MGSRSGAELTSTAFSGVGETEHFVNHFRYFSGLNYRLYRKGILQIEGRIAAERFVDLEGQDFTRFRHRATFGIRTNLNPDWSLLTGLIWENRSSITSRHVTGWC